MLARLRILIPILLAVSIASCSKPQGNAKVPYTKGQQLVIAAFELDVKRVKTLLAEETDPDTRLGFYDSNLFEDKWTFAYSSDGSDQWTPLLAVANSHREAQPHQRPEDTLAGRDAAFAKRDAIDPKLIAERDRRRVVIANLLIAAKANLDLDDGHGDTALSASVYSGFDELSLLLISANAKLDTTTGIYIDGAGDIAPVHRATKSPKVLQALIKRGANVNVVDTSGCTPLHWAVQAKNVDSVKMLLEAGAKLDVEDNSGRKPAYWCRTFGNPDIPGDAEKKQIAQLLERASQK